MNVFVANFTDADIDEKHIKRLITKHLAKQKTHRILKISVVFLAPARMQKLNNHYRKKDYIPDILTFPEPLYEIMICPEQAKKNGHSIDFLIEHGLNHLVGKHHG